MKPSVTTVKMTKMRFWLQGISTKYSHLFTINAEILSSRNYLNCTKNQKCIT